MSWWSIAAELVKGAMNAREPRPTRPPTRVPANDLNLAELLQRYREEVDRGFESLAQTIHEQNQRQMRALKIQQRWNYGLLAGLVWSLCSRSCCTCGNPEDPSPGPSGHPSPGGRGIGLNLHPLRHSRYRHSAFASFICRGVLHSGSSSFGLATTKHAQRAREVATLKRLTL
jgi:hypothetical protein